jgi:hypothetical protein
LKTLISADHMLVLANLANLTNLTDHRHQNPCPSLL